MLTRRALLVSLAALATPARARPTPYVLDPGASHVGFSFRLMGGLQRGDMPVTRADLVVDPADLAASTADVIVNPARARTGFFFVLVWVKFTGQFSVDLLNLLSCGTFWHPHHLVIIFQLVQVCNLFNPETRKIQYPILHISQF